MLTSLTKKIVGGIEPVTFYRYVIRLEVLDDYLYLTEDKTFFKSFKYMVYGYLYTV